MNPKLIVFGALMQLGLAGIVLAQDAAPTAAPTAVAPTTAATTQPGVTLVNLHLKQAMPEDVFFMLGKIGGIRFTPNGNLWDQDMMQVPMDVDFTDRPFWAAVRDVCGMWRVTLQPNFNGNSRRVSMMVSQMPSGNDRGWQPLPYFVSEGFLIEAVGFNRQQNINYNTPTQTQNSCNVQFRVYVDPAMRISSFNGGARVDEAADDADHLMVLDRNNRNAFGGGMQQQRQMIFDASAQLKYPDNAGKKITHLKCNLLVRGGDKMDALVVEKPLEAHETTKVFGDITITFRSLKKINNNYEAKLVISRADDDGRGGSDNWQLVQSAQLLDDKGRPFNNGGGGGGGGGNGRYTYSANYYPNNGGDDDPIGDPAKWVIELPMNTHAIRVPVEFSDLPLP